MSDKRNKNVINLGKKSKKNKKGMAGENIASQMRDFFRMRQFDPLVGRKEKVV